MAATLRVTADRVHSAAFWLAAPISYSARPAQAPIRAQAPTSTGDSQHALAATVSSLRRCASVSIATSAAVAIPNFSIAGSSERATAANTA